MTKKKGDLIFQNSFYDLKTGELSSPILTRSYTVIQAADSFYHDRAVIEEHRQICDFELTLVLSGEVECFADGVSVRVRQNEAFVSLRKEKHAIKSVKSSRFQTLAFNMNSDAYTKEAYSDICQLAGSAHRRRFTSCEVGAAMASVMEEFFSEDSPYRYEMLECQISRLLVDIARRIPNPHKKPRRNHENVLLEVANKIDESFLTADSLIRITESFNYSAGYVSRAFKELNGVSMREYLISKKIQLSKELLEDGESIKEIAAILGYSNPYNFTRAFTREVGLSPTKYREKSSKEGKRDEI